MPECVDWATSTAPWATCCRSLATHPGHRRHSRTAGRRIRTPSSVGSTFPPGSSRLREAALLGKAWGITPDWIVKGITGNATYFTGFDGLNTAYEAGEGLVDEW